MIKSYLSSSEGVTGDLCSPKGVGSICQCRRMDGQITVRIHRRSGQCSDAIHVHFLLILIFFVFEEELVDLTILAFVGFWSFCHRDGSN